MKRLLTVVVCFFSLAPLGMADDKQPAPPSVDTKAASAKYGIVDMQSVILNVAEGKDEKGKLEKEIKAKEAEFKKRQDEIAALNKELTQGAGLMNEDAKNKKAQEFQEKLMTYRNDEMNFKGEIQRKEQAATQKIAVKVAEIVEKMARERDLEAVFEANSAGLLYVRSPVDLTEEVIKAYDSTPAAAKKKIEPLASAKK